MNPLRENRCHISVNLLAIDDHLGDTLAHVLRVLHFDFVGSALGMQGFTIRPLKLARTPMMNCVAAW